MKGCQFAQCIKTDPTACGRSELQAVGSGSRSKGVSGAGFEVCKQGFKRQ